VVAVYADGSVRDDAAIGEEYVVERALSASIRTCARLQLMFSSSGISRLRLREGSASNSRLRGQFDAAFIFFNRARFALASSFR
jgi:hypothetical protein